MSFSDTLHELIAARDWDKVLARIVSHPAEVFKLEPHIIALYDGIKKSSALALHHCLAVDAPLNVIVKLLETHTSSIKFTETAYHRLPLHLALYYRARNSVVLELLGRYPEAVKHADYLGRLPLHYCLANQHPQVIQEALIDAYPESIKNQDQRGWLPLHIAIGAGAPLVFVRPLVFPGSLLIACNEGYIPLEAAELHLDNGENVDPETLQYLEAETPYRMPTPRLKEEARKATKKRNKAFWNRSRTKKSVDKKHASAGEKTVEA